MEIRLYTVKDWLNVFRSTNNWHGQINMIRHRQKDHLPLATWEQNCLRAYEQLQTE